MTGWPAFVFGATVWFALDQVWSWYRKRRKARQDAPWDRAVERHRVR